MTGRRDPASHNTRVRVPARRNRGTTVSANQLDVGDLLHWGLPPDRYGRQRLLAVYLAGPIAGLLPNEALDWREQVTGQLAARAPHIRCLDPMRDKNDLSCDSPIRAGEGGDIYDPELTVARDLWDVASADIVLMNLTGSKNVSIGSMIELGHAAALRKLIIVVLPPRSGEGEASSPNPYDHPFVRQVASSVVHSLADAVRVLESA